MISARSPPTLVYASTSSYGRVTGEYEIGSKLTRLLLLDIIPPSVSPYLSTNRVPEGGYGGVYDPKLFPMIKLVTPISPSLLKQLCESVTVCDWVSECVLAYT